MGLSCPVPKTPNTHVKEPVLFSKAENIILVEKHKGVSRSQSLQVGLELMSEICLNEYLGVIKGGVYSGLHLYC